MMMVKVLVMVVVMVLVLAQPIIGRRVIRHERLADDDDEQLVLDHDDCDGDGDCGDDGDGIGDGGSDGDGDNEGLNQLMGAGLYGMKD